MSSDEQRIVPVHSGVKSSFDIPVERHNVSEEKARFYAPPPEPVQFSVERALAERVAVLEAKVEALWQKLMDKPIDIHSGDS